MNNPTLLIVAPFVALLFGCATTPRITQTPSGWPEITIQTADAAKVKALVVSDMSGAGWQLSEDGAYRLVFQRETSPGDELLLRLAIGNAYSTKPIIQRSFTIAHVGSTVRVTVHQAASSQMPFGQVNSMQLNDNRSFNGIQTYLQGLKNRIESQAPAASVEASVAPVAVR